MNILFLFVVSILPVNYWIVSPLSRYSLQKYLEAEGARERTDCNIVNMSSYYMPLSFLNKIKKAKNGIKLFPVSSGKDYTSFANVDYGEQKSVLEVINVPKAHREGYLGQNITIGIFDTGFDSTHPALFPIFSSGRVKARYDFNSGDHFVVNGTNITPVDSEVYINSIAQCDSYIAYSKAYPSALQQNEESYELILVHGDKHSVVSQARMPVQPDITCANDSVFLVWEQRDGLDMDIFAASYYGMSASSSVQLTNDIEDDLYPSIDRQGDYEYITFYKKNTGIYIFKAKLPDIIDTITIPLSMQVYGLATYVMDSTIYLSVNFDTSFAVYRLSDTSYYLLKEQSGNFPVVFKDNNAPFVMYSADSAIYKESLYDSTAQFIQNGMFVSFPARTNDRSIYFIPNDFYLYKYDISNSTINIVDSGFIDAVCGGAFLSFRRRGDFDIKPFEYSDEGLMAASMHGTEMMSLVGGFWEGRMVGSALLSDFVLAKTERISAQEPGQFENVIEEDFWVEALEWSIWHKVNIISSSLGYSDWYEKKDMNGETAVSSRAASKALSSNVLVVNAIGNEESHSITPDTTLSAPSDAKGIIAVGGTDSTGTKPELCSYGPSADGRIKPELVAPFNGYFVDDTGMVYRLGGTSVSTALVSGGAAVVWSGHPSWDAAAVRNAMLNTCTELPGYPAPNNITGHGLVNVYRALYYETPVKQSRDDIVIISPYPNPFPRTKDIYLNIPVRLVHRTSLHVFIVNIGGTRLKDVTIGGEKGPGTVNIKIRANDLAPGLYTILIHTGFGAARSKFLVKE